MINYVALVSFAVVTTIFYVYWFNLYYISICLFTYVPDLTYYYNLLSLLLLLLLLLLSLPLLFLRLTLIRHIYWYELELVFWILWILFFFYDFLNTK